MPAPLRVRLALHTGEADLREGDYYGSTVNRCARLRAIASCAGPRKGQGKAEVLDVSGRAGGLARGGTSLPRAGDHL